MTMALNETFTNMYTNINTKSLNAIALTAKTKAVEMTKRWATFLTILQCHSHYMDIFTGLLKKKVHLLLIYV